MSNKLFAACGVHNDRMNAPNIRDCYCLQARRSARLLTQYYDESLRPSGLRAAQFILMAALRETQPATQQVLADLVGMDRTTLTRNLSVLQAEKCVTIAKDRSDGRVNRIRLTKAGARQLQKAMPLWTAVHTEVERQLKARQQWPLHALQTLDNIAVNEDVPESLVR